MSTPQSHNFIEHSEQAINDSNLQQALHVMKDGFIKKRRKALQNFPLFERYKEAAIDMRNKTMQHMDVYLEMFEKQAIKHGTQVHWCRDAKEACHVIHNIAKNNNAKTITKGKSMISEEIGLNEYLEAQNYHVIETDLGEYIIQLRHETPSHIIAPALHILQDEVKKLFKKTHTHLPASRLLNTRQDLVKEARSILREQYFKADIGITGANFLVAETGSSLIVTNEGNGDLTQNCADIHIAIASIDKIVPSLHDVQILLRLLARSATGQSYSSYTSFATGSKRNGDMDGPSQHHVILLDNGRSDLLQSSLHDMLRCIRCGACMNHCPVYHAVGGHAYGWVYPGPMGAVLTPYFIGVDKASHLPHASTFCGRCEEVCPMGIKLPTLLRHHRTQLFQRSHAWQPNKAAIICYNIVALRPKLYNITMKIIRYICHYLPKHKRYPRMITSFLIPNGWTRSRNFPVPQSKLSFIEQYKNSKHDDQ